MKNLRLLKRKDVFLPASIIVWNMSRDEEITSPVQGQIFNICKHGACLFTTRIMAGNIHLFHTTREENFLALRLFVTVTQDDDPVVLSAVPVWMDLHQNKDEQGFKIGLEFTSAPEEAHLKSLQKAAGAGTNLLSETLTGIFYSSAM